MWRKDICRILRIALNLISGEKKGDGVNGEYDNECQLCDMPILFEALILERLGECLT